MSDKPHYSILEEIDKKRQYRDAEIRTNDNTDISVLSKIREHLESIEYNNHKLRNYMEQTKLDELDNLRRAAGFDANYTYPSLFAQLGYRQAIAELLLKETDENKLSELRKLYDYTNDTIKKILGL